MEYYKLVRDRIPEIIANQGKKANIRILNDTEYTACLERMLEWKLIGKTGCEGRFP